MWIPRRTEKIVNQIIYCVLWFSQELQLRKPPWNLLNWVSRKSKRDQWKHFFKDSGNKWNTKLLYILLARICNLGTGGQVLEKAEPLAEQPPSSGSSTVQKRKQKFCYKPHCFYVTVLCKIKGNSHTIKNNAYTYSLLSIFYE